jgi:hypothetical protein
VHYFLTIEVASVQWFIRVSGNIVSRFFTQRLVELELVDVSCKVAHIAHVGSNMELATGVKVFLCAQTGWCNSC